MLILPRRPIDAEARSYAQATVPLEEIADRLLDHAEGWRPYAGGVVRHAVANPELRNLQELKGYDHYDVVADASIVGPLNRVMHRHWAADPRSEEIELADLKFEKLISHHGIHPHIDQSLDEKTLIPENGLLVALLAIKGVTQYGLKPFDKSPFDPQHQEIFLKEKRKPRPKKMDYVTLNPGDVLLIPTVSPVIHFSHATTQERLVAAYAARFRLAA